MNELSEIIRTRRTFKVLATPEHPLRFSEEDLQQVDHRVKQAIATAGWAPFHYARGEADLAEPWRVDWLSCHVCRQLSKKLPEWFDDVKPTNKLPAMLAACGSLVLVSWLPQFADATAPLREAQQQTEEEHLAASSAYVQNLLLLLTADGLGTYWSSGGQFRSHHMFEKLDLPHRGRLLAAVFVDYSEAVKPLNDASEIEAIQRLPGKLRDQRSEVSRWMHEVSIEA